MKGEVLASPQKPRDPFRKTFTEFISTIDTPSVRHAIQEAVVTPLSDEFETNLPPFLDAYVDRPLLKEHAPSWLDHDSFIFEVFKANSAAFWDGISHQAEEKDPGISGRLLFEIHKIQGPDHEECDFDLPRTMAKQNLRFFGIASIYFGLATIHGNDLVSATRYRGNETGFQERIAPILSAGKEIASSFPTPPQDASDILSRLYEVFSPNTVSERNAYHSLLSHKAFGEKTSRKGKEDHSCLGVKLTKDIFQSYAEVLTHPAYEQDFIKAVTR